jgi:hypothetical protein
LHDQINHIETASTPFYMATGVADEVPVEKGS